MADAEDLVPELDEPDRRLLLDLALTAVRSGLDQQPVAGLEVPPSPALNELGASFVTLERQGRLLGCVGTVEPVRPLYEDVMGNAYQSAFADPRLPACTREDYAAMDVKISVLGPLVDIDGTSRANLLAAIQPGVDGVLMTAGRHRATFLPAVWPRVRSADHFLDLLLDKARLGHRWPENMQAYRYRTLEFSAYGPRSRYERASDMKGLPR